MTPLSRSRSAQLFALVGFVVVAFLAPVASVGLDSSGWYRTLVRPAWAPPGWIFGPVWTVLYLLMGIAAWGVWRRVGWGRELGLWVVQLVLNAAWTPIFFGLHQPGWACVEIVALWVAIALTVRAFGRVVAWAGWLMAPYLAWVTFATALNFAIWRLNR